MVYNIYKLQPRFIHNGIFKGKNPPELVYSLDTGTISYCDFMNENWYDTLVWQEDIQEALELDIKYYVVAEDYSDFGVLVLHKGHSFFDTAEHDERVVIAVELGLTHEQAKILPKEY